MLSQAWLPGYQCLLSKALLALIGGSAGTDRSLPLLGPTCVLVDSSVILVAFYYLDQVKRACGLKWKAFSFKFGVMSELAQLKVTVSEEVGV